MKTILVDAISCFVIKGKGIFQEMYKLLEEYPHKKIILTNADDEQFKLHNLFNLPYEIFTLKHNPEKTNPEYYERLLKKFKLESTDVIYFEHNKEAVKSAKSIGINTYYYDSEKQDLIALKEFLDNNLQEDKSIHELDLVHLSKELMYAQTQKNKAPAWLLTELAIKKGKELSKKYNVDERLVLTSLYLANTIFSPIWKGDIQKNHPKLSAEFVKPYLNKWNINQQEQEIILNAVEAHHNKIPTTSKVAEVMKNAECFKFVTIEGSLIWLHELGLRQIPFKEAIDKVLQKMEQKEELLTLNDCIKEANKNCNQIQKLFGNI